MIVVKIRLKTLIFFVSFKLLFRYTQKMRILLEAGMNTRMDGEIQKEQNIGLDSSNYINSHPEVAGP